MVEQKVLQLQRGLAAATEAAKSHTAHAEAIRKELEELKGMRQEMEGLGRELADSRQAEILSAAQLQVFLTCTSF